MLVENNCNIVIVGVNFSPLSYNHHWLIKNNIVSEEQILKESFFTQDFTQIVTNDFFVSVFLNQMTFTLKAEKYTDEIIKTYEKFISNLTDVNFTAIGVNFIRSINNDDEENKNLSREHFFFENSEIHKLFDKPDARFGVYLSKDYLGSRLKLDIKPKNIVNTTTNIITKVIGFSFNFHLDLKVNKLNSIIGQIKNWQKFNDYSEEILNLYSK